MKTRNVVPDTETLDRALQEWMKDPSSDSLRKLAAVLHRLFDCCICCVLKPVIVMSLIPRDEIDRKLRTEDTVKLSLYDAQGKRYLLARRKGEDVFDYIPLPVREEVIVTPKDGAFCEREDVGEKLINYLTAKLPRNNPKRRVNATT